MKQDTPKLGSYVLLGDDAGEVTKIVGSKVTYTFWSINDAPQWKLTLDDGKTDDDFERDLQSGMEFFHTQDEKNTLVRRITGALRQQIKYKTTELDRLKKIVDGFEKRIR